MQWLLAIVAIAVTSFDVNVRTHDGETATGTLTAWNEQDIELTTDSGNQTIPREKLTEIQLAPSTEAIAAPAVELQFTDGSRVPAANCELLENKIAVQAPIWSAHSETPWLPNVDSVGAIRFDLTTPGQDEAWREIVSREHTADLLVVYKKSRGTLDYVEGVVNSATATIATILVDGEAIEVPRERVFGIVFYRQNKLPPPQNAVRITGPHGLTIIGRDVRLDNKTITIELAEGETISALPASVSTIKFATDELIYLSDLPQLSGSPKWRPFFELPANSTLMTSWGLPRRDESFDGGRLKVYMNDGSGRLEIREFDHGLAMRSRSEFVCRLPEGYRTLRAIIGMAPQAQRDADALLLVELDDRPVGEWRVASGEGGQAVEIDLTGKRQLRLIVDFGSGTDAGDVIHICEPGLAK